MITWVYTFVKSHWTVYSNSVCKTENSTSVFKISLKGHKRYYVRPFSQQSYEVWKVLSTGETGKQQAFLYTDVEGKTNVKWMKQSLEISLVWLS